MTYANTNLFFTPQVSSDHMHKQRQIKPKPIIVVHYNPRLRPSYKTSAFLALGTGNRKTKDYYLSKPITITIAQQTL